MSDSKTTRLSFLDFRQIRFNLSSKVAPFSAPEIVFFDTLEIALSKTEIVQIAAWKFKSPLLSPNYCFSEPQLWKFDYWFEKPEIEDLTLWLTEALIFPKIESVFKPLDSVKIRGKAYPKKGEEKEKEPVQLKLSPDIRCRHGLTEDTCQICYDQELEKTKTAKRKELEFDIFDLIFPMLFPPLKLESISEFLPNKELYDFQPKGIKFLASRQVALLGDEMGLGKTIQAIVAIKILFHRGKITNALIVCPRSVFTTWLREFEDWAPEIRIIAVRGLKTARGIKWSTPSHAYLTTYETLREDIERLPKKDFDICVLDEIQKIKNPTAKVAKTMRQIDSKIRWGLSGTPLENRVEELIAIFAYLKPGLLRYDDAPYHQLVRDKIKPYFLRRRKTDVLKDLPKKRRDPGWIDLGPAQRIAYDKAEKEGIVALNEYGETVTVQHILALITKLKQICNLDVVSGESAKLEYLKDKLEAVEEQGDKALIYSQFVKKTLKFLEPRLKKFNPLVYHGELSDKQREFIIEKFQKEEENKILLASVRATSLGLNLQRANYVFHFDQWWNPATSAQAEDRTHRIGQKRTVFVTILMATGTIEERIHNLLKRKQKLFNEVVDSLSDDDLIKGLTKDDFLDLFNISKEKASKTANKTSAPKKGLEEIYRLSPIEFEKLILRLYESMGYSVKETPISRDEGVDLYAKRVLDSGIEYLIVQCKHYPNGKVGVEHVRALYGVLTHKQDVTRGVLITSGQFSSGAKNFASGKRIQLYDGNYLAGLLHKYDVSVV